MLIKLSFMVKKKKRLSYLQAIITTLLFGVGSWAVFSLSRLGIEKALLLIGLEAEWMQYVAIILVVIIFALATGYGFKKAIDKLA